ncbi:MAG: VWA domain-containing protein [Alphaproteobacteria bacterium]|nr:VWA domain-containing protein [Alphaproteobacteria bacterium]
MADDRKNLPTRSSRAEVDGFLARLKAAPRAGPGGGRLIFAMDATASREPTWERACRIQGEMFLAADGLGGLSVQLCWYRGLDEFGGGKWAANAGELLQAMHAVHCRGGQTQIVRVLRHAAAETRRQRVAALVFVGDCMEEDIDRLCHAAGELGLLGVPAFMFHEGRDPVARKAFEEVARLTKGACCPFDAASADQLRDLLAAVAAYAAGGRRALEDFGRRRGGAALLLTHRFAGGR